MPKAGKRIVLDASVARSAGSGPIPGRRRAVFNAIEKQDHFVVFSRECLAEWKDHAQEFARGWLTRMISSKRWIHIADTRDDQLRSKLSDAASNMHRDPAACDRRRREMDKDAHLLEASLLTDRIVISLDEEVRGFFRMASAEVQEIARVMWANPEIEEDQVVPWLDRGARVEKARELGHPG
jgi:hypothetical protein